MNTFFRSWDRESTPLPLGHASALRTLLTGSRRAHDPRCAATEGALRRPRRFLLPVMIMSLALLAPAAYGQTLFGAPPPQAFPFMLNPIEEAALTVGGLGLTGLAYALHGNKPAPNEKGLVAADIPPFDRLSSDTYSRWMSDASWGTLGASLLVPGVDLPGMNAEQIGTMGAIYGETLLLAFGAKEMMKAVVIRYRPYAYNPATPPALLDSRDVEDSFPSGHVVGAFAAAAFAGYTYGQLYPNSSNQGLVWVTGLALGGITAILRVASGNHFPSDVFAGALLGSAIGLFVPWLHTQIQPIP